MNVANVVNVSGGKDSTAVALLAIERGVTPAAFVFADTGHEHPQTIDYVAKLSAVLRERCGVGVTTVRADFAADMARKRAYIAERWEADGVPAERVERAIECLKPTGTPFLDLCMLKGRFPSTRVRFCTTELKTRPVQTLLDDLAETHRAVVSWIGVRADESRARAKLAERDAEFGSWEPAPVGMLVYRPILAWSAADVVDYVRNQGVALNPLYSQGMGRVGCMPCIHARKEELREIARRFPEEFDRVERWEALVQGVSKGGAATLFAANKAPNGRDQFARGDDIGIRHIEAWANTGTGGRQVLLDIDEAPQCSSLYGLCE